MAREYFAAYHSYLRTIDPLNDAERGRLFTALLEYSSTGIEPELRGNERYVFPGIKEQIDRDKEAYEKKCEQNRNNVYSRYRSYTNVYERIQDKGKEKGKDKGKEKGKEKYIKNNIISSPTKSDLERLKDINEKIRGANL